MPTLVFHPMDQNLGQKQIKLNLPVNISNPNAQKLSEILKLDLSVIKLQNRG